MCVCVLCLPILQFSACLLFPLGVFFVHFCFLLLLKDPLSPARESSPHLSSGIMTEQNSQSRTQRRMGSHRPPAPNVRSPLYQRILQFQALISLGQQGIDVRKFALRFSGAVEGLGYNDAALKDLLNSALEEPPNWWRMRGLEHLIFGEFVDFLESAPGDHRVRSESPQSPLLKWWFSAPPWWPPALPAPPWHPCPPLLPGPLPLHGPGPPSLYLIRLRPTPLLDIIWFWCVERLESAP